MKLPPAIRLLRPHQWVKNIFVVAALFFTPGLLVLASVERVAIAFLLFSAAASAVYILNDMRDRAADRLHPVKKMRPIASGAVSPAAAMAMLLLLGGGALAAAWWYMPAFAIILTVYVAMNIGYSLGLKHVSILDIMIVAMGFVLRVVAGAAVLGIEASVWIVTCTGLLALFIAIAKRRDDVINALDGSHRKSLAGYNLEFLDSALTASITATFVCYAMYVSDERVMTRMGSQHLYYTLPFVLAGLLRYLQVTVVEKRSGSPTHIAVSDPFMLCVLGGWMLTFAALIYGPVLLG